MLQLAVDFLKLFLLIKAGWLPSLFLHSPEAHVPLMPRFLTYPCTLLCPVSGPIVLFPVGPFSHAGIILGGGWEYIFISNES